MKKYTVPKLRLGCTSFLTGEDYVSGFRSGAALCGDISLLLVSVGERGEYLVRRDEVREIRHIAEGEGTDINIHLPVDAMFDTPEGAWNMVKHVEMAIERTAVLEPNTFVLHVDMDVRNSELTEQACADRFSNVWQAVDEALCAIAAMLPAPECLAIENLEFFSPSFWDRCFMGRTYSRCIDIGHLWKDGLEPALWLKAWLPRARILHLHGLASRRNPAKLAKAGKRILPETALAARFRQMFGAGPDDHTSLRFMPDDCVDSVMHTLWRSDYRGVLTLEVFTLQDFKLSHEKIMQSWERYQKKECYA